MVTAVAVAGLVLGSIMTNLVRLGPSSVTLPEPPLAISAAWFRFPDGDSAHDYYAILVKVMSLVDTASVYPYRIDVNVTVIGGEGISGWYPMAGDHPSQQQLPLSWGGSPPDMTLNLPAGLVENGHGGSYMLWTVLGKRGLQSQPIFTSSGDFYVEFALPENATLEAHPEVLLEWDYANALQAYPIAVRGTHAVCSYVPTADSEGTAPYGSCG